MATPTRIIYTPQEAAKLGNVHLQRLADSRDRLMPVGLPGLDDYMLPIVPGEMVTVQAKTHSYKTGFMRSWAYRFAGYLASKGRDEVIIWVDTENTVEQLALEDIGNYSGSPAYHDAVYGRGIDPAKLMRASVAIAETSIYYVATRLYDDRGDDSAVSLTNIKNSIGQLVSGKVDGKAHNVAAVFVDYLQALPYDAFTARQQNGDTQRRIQVMRDVDTCRRMGALFNCPVIVGAQAKQELGGAPARGINVPGMYDAQETSFVAQRSDRMISLWLPEKDYTIGTNLEYAGRTFSVSSGQLWLRPIKQRGFRLPSGDMFVYQIDWNAPNRAKEMSLYWSQAASRNGQPI